MNEAKKRYKSEDNALMMFNRFYHMCETKEQQTLVLNMKQAFLELPTTDVVPKSEVEEMQECIYDLYTMLDEIICRARNNDLSALRPLRGACGCDAYQGVPPICRKFDNLLDKHEEAIHKSAKFVELEKNCTEGNRKQGGTKDDK